MKTAKYLSLAMIGVALLIGCAHSPKQDMMDQNTETQSAMNTETTENNATSFTVNGLKVIVKRTPGNPVVSTGFFVNGGTRYVPESQAGIENFLFNAATHGTENLSKDNLNSRLESMGTHFSTVNQYDYTGLSMTSLKRTYDQSWDLFEDVLLHPAFAQEEVDLARQQIQAAIKSEQDDPDSYVSLIADKLYYNGFPYAVSLNGKADVIANITPEDLHTYHDTKITKTRGLLVVVGDLSPDMVKSKVQSLATALPTGPGFTREDGNFTPGPAAVDVVQRDLPTNYILGYCPAPAPGSADYPAFSAGMRILHDKLWEEIRTKRNLSYAPASGVSRRATNYGYLYITTTKPDTSIKVMFATVDSMATKPLPKKDVKNEVTSSITRDLMNQETAQAQMTKLARYELVGGGYMNAKKYLDELQQLTPIDIQNAVQKYTHDYHFGILGDPNQIDKALFTSR